MNFVEYCFRRAGSDRHAPDPATYPMFLHLWSVGTEVRRVLIVALPPFDQLCFSFDNLW